jgi:hypothetical protein
MKRRIVTTLAFLLACGAWAPVLGACGGASPGTSTASSGSASQSIGTSGGTAMTLEGAGVSIPAGALAATTAITVATKADAPLPAHATAVGTPYVFGPEGTTFLVPVTVTLPFSAGEVPAGRSTGDIVIYTAPLGSTVFTRLPTVLADATHAQATTTHFSVFVTAIDDQRDDAGVATGDAGDAGGDDAADDADAVTTAQCSTDADCAVREVCIDGECVVPDVDAGGPDADDAGAADDAADAGDAPQCRLDTDCPPEQACVDGICVAGGP